MVSTRRSALALGGALAALPLAASAQAYPTRAVRIIAPFPAGGGYDFMARNIGTRLNEALGQQFLVENRSGANGNIGSEAVAKAAPECGPNSEIATATANSTKLEVPIKHAGPAMLCGRFSQRAPHQEMKKMP